VLTGCTLHWLLFAQGSGPDIRSSEHQTLRPTSLQHELQKLWDPGEARNVGSLHEVLDRGDVVASADRRGRLQSAEQTMAITGTAPFALTEGEVKSRGATDVVGFLGPLPWASE
jgi:hypothetical protein